MGGFDPRVVRAAYDAVADTYVKTFGDDLDDAGLDLDRSVLDGIADGCAALGPVLDLGCGPAHICRYLAARSVDMIGVDFAPAMLAAARRMNPGATLVRSDIRALPVRSRSVAGVIAFYMLQHFARAELSQILGEVRRVLVVGGSLALAVHEGEGEFHPTAEITATCFAGDELVHALTAASFAVETIRRRRPLAHERQGDRVYVTARAS